MKRMVLISLIATLVSCGGKNVRLAQNSNLNNGSMGDSQNQVFYGNWDAYIEQISAKSDSIRLVVNGSVELENPNAKVILIKAAEKKQIFPNELILNLSKRPVNRKYNPAIVTYIENFQKIGHYKKIHIMYRKDTVAMINTIRINKNEQK
jgi:hypothetical protein